MKQICDGYNPHVLMGNWYEESYSVPQPVRQNPIKTTRVKQVDIGFIDDKGKLKQLNTVARLQPWNTDKLLTAPQFSENKCNNKTQMKQKYDLQTTNNFHNQWKQPQPFNKQNTCNQNNRTYVQIDKFNKHHRLFNQRNINELLNERPSDEKSFRSQLKPNTHVNQKQLLQTTYQMYMLRPAEEHMKMTNSKFNMTNGSNQQKNQLNQSQQASNFRRIRSQITLKTTTNFPFTYK